MGTGRVRSALESGLVLSGLGGGEPAGDPQQRGADGEQVLAPQERGVPLPLPEELLSKPGAARVGEDLNRSASLNAAGWCLSDVGGVDPAVGEGRLRRVAVGL